MSTQDVVAGLAAAAQKLEQGRAKAAAAAQDYAEARELVAAALRGAAAGPLLGLIDRLHEAAEQAQGIDLTQQRVNETIQNAQALGNF
jgi:type VI protein secretion system component VasF